MSDASESFLVKIQLAGIRLFRLKSIKGKIFILFAATFLSITVLTALNFWNLSMLRTRMLLSEGYDDLLNNILEVRRFEKNYLIYKDNGSLAESREYLDRIDLLVKNLAEDLPQLAGGGRFAGFQATFRQYREIVDRIGQGDMAAPEMLRKLGKTLTDEAHAFREIKRERIHATIERSSMLPVAFLAIFIFLMVLVLWLLSHGLLKPLDVVMETTRMVGRGDFRPIHYQGVRLEEIAGLIDAFNRMAYELETNQEDLIQAKKIAAIGTFTAGIAHELNNPINNIVLTAESFQDEYRERLDPHCSEMLSDILGQAERAAEIVRNLLDFSRTENPAFTRISPDMILSTTLNLMKNQFKLSDVHFHTAVADDLPFINGNLSNLQQVFTNLLLNAIQVTPAGETINICIERAKIPGYVSIGIEDAGPGIPQDNLHKIFEPFFSTKEVGTGLGLTVSYSIIKRHGGRIEVGNGAGRGARFTVLLPCLQEAGGGDFIGWTAS